MVEQNVGVEIKEHPVYVGYGASRDGRVWSRFVRGSGAMCQVWQEIRPSSLPSGRKTFSVYRNGFAKGQQVCRFVLDVFVGPCPDGCECCHNDGDPTNDLLENLRWDTHKNNISDKVGHGTHTRGEKHSVAKLTDAQVVEIRKRYAAGGISQAALGAEYGVSGAAINLVVRRINWNHLP
jgi:hypothetical protein